MVVFYNMTENEVKSYSNFHISIEINENQISLLLVNKENSKPESIEHISRESKTFEEAIKSSEIVSLVTPQTVSCTVVNSHFTLVPKALYNTELKENYLKQITQLLDTQIVKEDELMNKEIISCFAMERELNSNLLKVFPTVKTKHISSVLCDSAPEGVSINFSTELSYEVVIKKEKKIMYFNRFQFENKDESIYYLSLIAEKHGINLAKEPLNLSGKIFADSETLLFWKQFIPEENITFNAIEVSQMNAVSRHQFFTLHKQHSCVL